jgi:precorrin-2/cobalt-factor-2 C20-methyltransferase
MTRKAVKTIEGSGVIVYPEARGKSARILAYDIAKEAYPQITEKEAVGLYLPMTRDADELAANRDKATDVITSYLAKGTDVVFVTLGDPSIYSTYIYLHRLVIAKGYQARIIPGITSFCAAAAATNDGLVDAEQALHVIPASYPNSKEALNLDGTKVLMKTGKTFGEIREYLANKADKGVDVRIVENCGMENERIWTIDEVDDEHQPGYFTIVIVKE